MAIKTILISAFVALVAAFPQHAEHIGNAQIARSNQVFARGALAGRMISFDGSCGSWSGATCADNGCCSAQGWCGSTAAHCGTGCQVGFGQCGSSGDSQPPVAQSSAPQAAPPAPVVTLSSSSTPPPAPVVTLSSSSAPATAPAPASTPPPTTSAPITTTTTSSSSAFIPAVASDIPSLPNTGPGPKQPVNQPLPVTTTVAVASVNTPASSPSPISSSQSSGLGDTYKMYMGDGSLGAGWPAQSEWVDFDTAFDNNRGLLSQSCAQFGAANNNADEINNLKSALQSVAASTGVDDRFLLAIVMQESGGCVRAPTTNYGVRNPGLFQSHDGAGTCNDSGNVQSPCPMSEITQMVTDGAAGTAEGDGLKQTISEAGTSDVSKYYRAARIYNSGSIAASGQLQDGIATHCYSSDVANRLTGWVHAAHGCSA